jgi:hypothetical protein
MKRLNVGYVRSETASFSPLLINARKKGGDTCGSSFSPLLLERLVIHLEAVSNEY